MKTPLISIIVPVYNVEKYLEKCILSLCSQTYKNIEILLIDDGSTDKSKKICDDLKKKDERIRVVHKKNQGLSSARNEGIKLASGQFLAFVDSDDYVENDMIELLYKNMEKYNAEISACGYIMVYNERNVLISNNNDVVVYKKIEALEKMFLKNDIGMIFCNKLFKKDLFKNVEFPLYKNFEDINTMYKIINKADKIVYDPSPKYYYLQRNDSINGRNFKDKKFNDKIYDLYDATCEVYEFIKKCYPEILYNASVGCTNNLLRVNNQLIIYNIRDENVIKKTQNIIRENYKKVIFDKEISLIRKIQYFLFFKLNWIYKVTIRIIK